MNASKLVRNHWNYCNDLHDDEAAKLKRRTNANKAFPVEFKQQHFSRLGHVPQSRGDSGRAS
jgi:hypothetical protein